MDDDTLTIGQFARRAGLNVSAIRYYEAQGLLPEAPRVGGQRRYSEATLNRLGVIDVAKRAGFSSTMCASCSMRATRGSLHTPGSRNWQGKSSRRWSS